MKIRMGLEGNRAQVITTAREIGSPVMVSANALWRRSSFSDQWKVYAGLDVALDSGGFVAMKKYGGYRFTEDQYVGLASAMKPTWWAAMDFCCEPELAADQAAIFRRIDSTVEYLHRCQSAASKASIRAPMPVLQGWRPEDYCSGPIYDPGFVWPDLVGVGSVCRRRVHGPDGLLEVVAALDKKVPPHVKFHLFGVKGTALRHLAGHPRIESTDSMAHSMRARWEAVEGGFPCDNQHRADHFRAWYRDAMQKISASQGGPSIVGP